MKPFTLLCLGFISFFPDSLSGQKISLKDYDVKANYYQLPAKGIPSDIHSYHVELIYDEFANSLLEYKTVSLKNKIKLPGFSRFKEPVGLKVFVQINSPTGSSLELKSINRENKEGKKWKEYYYEVVFNGKTFVKVFDKKGNILGDYNSKYKEKDESSKYKSVKELKKYFSSTTFYRDGRRAAVNDGIAYVNRILSGEFGRVPKTTKVEFKRVKDKGDKKLQDFNKNLEFISLAFEKMTHESNEQFLKEAQTAIDYWTNLENDLSGSHKQEKKLKYACQYNTALAYFWAEEFDMAVEYANRIINGDYKEKSGKKIVKEITRLKQKFETTGYRSRHMSISPTADELKQQQEFLDFLHARLAEGDLRYLPDFKYSVNLKDDSQVKKSSLFFKERGELTGFIVYEDSTGFSPDFRHNSKIRFAFMDDDELLVKVPNYSKLDSVVIESKCYGIKEISLEDAMVKGFKIDNAIIHVLKDYNKSQLLLVSPPALKIKMPVTGKLDDVSPSLVIYHKEHDAYYDPSVSGLWTKKTFNKMLEGCKAALDYYENNKKSTTDTNTFSHVKNYRKLNFYKEILGIYDSCE